MDGLHGEGVSQDQGDCRCSAESGEPIPGEQACDRSDETRTVGSTGLEARCRSGLHIVVSQECTLVAQEADVHGTGRQVDTAVKIVWLGVESPEVSSFLG
jgi:hypothetical protein